MAVSKMNWNLIWVALGTAAQAILIVFGLTQAHNDTSKDIATLQAQMTILQLDVTFIKEHFEGRGFDRE